MRSRCVARSQRRIVPSRSVVMARDWLSGENTMYLARWIGITMVRVGSHFGELRSQRQMPGAIPPAARDRPSGENATALAYPG